MDSEGGGAMIYFVTGASGFIGKRLVRTLLARPESVVYFLMRNPAPERVDALRAYWGADASRAIPVKGDLTQNELGVGADDVAALSGKVDHFFHLAAIYDMEADAEEELRTNIEGTRNAVQFAGKIEAKLFQHTSSIAAAGLYEGVFREDMFEEAENLDHPYYRSKHDSEGVVRKECKIPWRVYRPGIVVGDSTTGEMDKIDGPYYFFKLIQKVRKTLPPWFPTVGIEGGRINVVPVDFIVAAMDHLAHLPGLDGRAFHLTDGDPYRVGEVLSLFANAAHAPKLDMRINTAMLGLIPKGLKKTVMSFAPVRRVRDAVLKDLGLPADVLGLANYPTRFDNREAEKLLKPAGITVPRLENYAWRLWDYWERHLDPDLFVDRTLAGKVKGKVVVVTGGSAGIGKATAFKLAEAGAVTIICGRDVDKLEEAKKEAADRGFALIGYPADLSSNDGADAFAKILLENHGGCDILVNNAGRSIRRSIELSFERFHDFERNMQINYFGALRLTMDLLPSMIAKKRGHVINISSIGVLTNAPRFSAYVASKAALEAWTRCAASELLDKGIEFTSINMPLVRTEMIAPTKIYNNVPVLSPEEAADMIAEAIIHKPVRIATRLGIAGQVLHALAPRVAQVVMNTTFRMFPDSAAAQGKKSPEQTTEQLAMTQLLKGVHF
jgi:NAD(P)-dependent dehydrogenase (short-subunit alcohol dehydrogenase family)